jgi:hypothetical protein
MLDCVENQLGLWVRGIKERGMALPPTPSSVPVSGRSQAWRARTMRWYSLLAAVAACSSHLEAADIASSAPPIRSAGPVVPNRAPKTAFVQPESTRRMVERLAELRRELERNPMASPFASAETAEVLRKQLTEEADPHLSLMLRPKLAMQLLNAGKSEEALAQLDQFGNGMEALRLRLDPQMQARLTIQRALCFLRLGEQENCLATHTSDSCLFPIQGAGIHQIERGSRGAIEALSGRLRSSPDDLQARWLLNLAHMTLGEYPDRVDPAWLIAPRLFAPEYDIKRFRNVAGTVGLDFSTSTVTGGLMFLSETSRLRVTPIRANSSVTTATARSLTAAPKPASPPWSIPKELPAAISTGTGAPTSISRTVMAQTSSFATMDHNKTAAPRCLPGSSLM